LVENWRQLELRTPCEKFLATPLLLDKHKLSQNENIEVKPGVWSFYTIVIMSMGSKMGELFMS